MNDAKKEMIAPPQDLKKSGKIASPVECFVSWIVGLFQNPSRFDLFYSLTEVCDVESETAKLLAAKCRFCDASEDAEKRILQSCSRGYVSKEDMVAILEGSDGLLKDPERALERAKNRFLWDDFVKAIDLGKVCR